MADKTVLVTGGAGYIGSHVCKRLAENGYTPITYDNLSSGNIEAVQWGPFEGGNILDRARLKEVMRKHKPDSIMHFAALIRVNDSVTNPAAYYENNVLGSFALLEEARSAGIKNIVLSSTAAVYGIPEQSPVPEDAVKKPINPYGQTKLAMEMMVRDFAAAYDSKFAILRYFNASGADPETRIGSAYKIDSHIIPLLLRAACGLIPSIKLFGEDYETPDGTAIRDYIHVTDLANAHILALEYILAGKENLTLNIGTNDGSSVAQVIDAARRITGQEISVERAPRRAGDPGILVADATAARQILNWQPAFSNLEIIIDTAWKWRMQQNKTAWAV